jgi:Domain of unknown function (DUF4168)
MHSTEHRATKLRPSMNPLAAAVLGAACLLVAPAATAQNRTQDLPQPQSPSPTVSDDKLNAAAAAVGEVSTLRQSYEQRIEKAPEAEKPRIAGEANKALVKAVTDQGISVDEYNSIMKAAQTDPAIRQKLAQRLQPSRQ